MELKKIQSYINNKTSLSIYLQSGIQLRGKIIEQDTTVVILDNDTVEQIVYKHAISTIVPKGGE